MIFLLAGFLFLSYGAKIRANPYRNIRKLLSGEINAKLHFEAEYIDLHSFNFTSRIVKMTKVRFHIYGSRNNKYYMLLNLEDYFQIIKFLKEKLPVSKYSINLTGISKEPEPDERNHLPSVPDLA